MILICTDKYQPIVVRQLAVLVKSMMLITMNYLVINTVILLSIFTRPSFLYFYPSKYL